MKRINFKFLAVAILVAVTAYSCIDDKFDNPPITELPEGSIVTIQKLRDLCPPGNTYKIEGDTSLYAVVTMDEMSGNIYRNIFIQDNTGAVNLRFGSTSGLYEGDSIRLYLKGAVLSWYNNLFQIDSLHADYNVIKQATNRNVEPELATISQINADHDYYQSRLVKIEDVQVKASDTASIWAPYQQYGEIFIEDTQNKSMLIRTSGYAKFAGENVPNGSGSIIAIVGLYRETVQLGIRRTSEVDLYGERFGDEGPGEGEGSGSFEDPYNVAAVITNNSGTDKWVEGYIVGVMETSVDPYEATFDGPFVTNSNMIIAASPTETNLSNCLIVQLPFGEVRSALNLVDNESNLGKEVMVRGDLMAYFSSPGVKNTDGYWIDGDGLNPDDVVPIDAFFEEDFTSNLGSFTAYSISGDQVWEWKNYDNGCAVMTGHVNPNSFANEDWLISPAIDLTGKSSVVMNIREAVNYITDNGYDELQVLVSTDYDGTSAPSTASWTELTGFNRPVGSDWNFVDSGDISMSAYDGETIHIAFMYKSTTADASTWEVGKVILFEQQ